MSPERSPRLSRFVLWAAVLAATALLAILGQPPRDAAPDARTELRVGLHSTVSTLDPHARLGESDLQLLDNVFEGLVGTDENMSVTPGLAVSWRGGEDRRWIFELREGVRFHDGSLFGPEDVVFSIQRAAQRHASRPFRARPLRDRSVEIEVDHPDPLFLVWLRDIAMVPEGFDGTAKPVGTGPYRVVDLDAERGWFELRAFEDYWRGEARIQNVRLSAIPDPAIRVRRLLDGELDLIDRVSPARAAEIDEAECCRVLAVSGYRFFHLTLRVDRPPFDDLRVRQAVDCSLDRQGLIEASEGGLATILGQYAPREVHGHLPEFEPVPRDLERARELLAAAGHPEGLDFVMEGAGRPAAFERMADQLRQAGFRPEVRLRPWPEFYSRYQAGEVDFAVMAWNFTAPDLGEFLEELGHTPSPERGFGAGNHSGYSNPAFDALIERLVVTRLPTERLKLMAAAQRLLLEDLPLVPLYSPLAILGSTQRLELVPRPNGYVYPYDMRWRDPASEAAPAVGRRSDEAPSRVPLGAGSIESEKDVASIGR